MSPDLSPSEQRRGTRSLILWGCALAAVLLVAVSLWPLLPGPETGGRPDGVRQQQADNATGLKTDQHAVESSAGKADPAAPEDSTGAKARAIQQTSQPLSLSEEERQRLRTFFTGSSAHRVESVDFSVALGSAVPRQTEVRPLPDEVADVLKGYKGAEYVIVRDQLVIVDPQARRVVAVVPGVA